MPRKLLLADDSVTIQRVIELTFSGEDVDVVTVGDGEQAIARIPAERPDIVLADIGMPKRSGYEVAAFVKGHPDWKHVPVLLLAGAFEPVDEAKAEQVGCDGVLVKPFEPQQVIARVHELLDGAKGSPTQAIAAVPRPAERLAQVPRNTMAVPESESPEPEARSLEPDASSPEPERNPALDEYFDRLDAAFATKQGNTAPVIPDLDTELELPTLDDVLSTPAPPPDLSLNQPSAGDNGRTVVADAFSALLALEAGEPGAVPVRLTTAAPEPAVTDAMIEEVTRRVLQRLAPDAARQAVVEVVSDVAERLVREEIARIRGGK